MNNIVTIENIVNRLKQYATDSKFLNDYGYGQTFEIGTTRKMKFPYLWVTLDSTSSVQIINKTAIPMINFAFIIADRLNIQPDNNERSELSHNGLQITSDTFQIAQDLLIELVKWGKDMISIDNDNISLEPLYDDTDDKVNGWVVRLGIKLPFKPC